MARGREVIEKNGECFLYCNSCGKEKPMDSFNKDKRSLSGYQSKCKDCEKRYRSKNKTKIKEYLAKNKDKIAKQQRQYYLDNKDAINSWRRSYYSNDGRLKVLASNAERRALKLTTSDGSVNEESIYHLYVSQEGNCAICGEELKNGKNSFHIDHIKPLSKNGEHKIENIQITCPTCNLKKGSDFLEEYTLGRPTKFDPEIQIPKMEEMMREGASIEEVCAELDISKNCFYEWCKKYEHFNDAKKRCEEYSFSWWMKLGRDGLICDSKPETKKLNYTGYYMNMKNRFGWKDKQDITSNDQTVNITYQEID